MKVLVCIFFKEVFHVFAVVNLACMPDLLLSLKYREECQDFAKHAKGSLRTLRSFIFLCDTFSQT